MSQAELYCCRYNYKGKEYGFTIAAESWEDAEDILKNRMQYARVDGKHMLTIPVPGGGILLRLWNWIKGGE